MKNPTAQCSRLMPGQIKAICVRSPTNSNENWPFICVFNKPPSQWVAVVAHLCWQVCCPFGVLEMVINSAARQAGELPAPATYQPPVTPNTAKCGAHPIPSHKTAQKRIQWMNSSTLNAFYTQIYECGRLPGEKKQTKYLQNITACGSYLHFSVCSFALFQLLSC